MPCDKRVVATGEHNGGVLLDEWEGMSVKVSEHCVSAPATETTNLVRVDTSEQQHHSAA